jgi:hypothetical protein
VTDSESSIPSPAGSTSDPNDLGELDPEQFVGESPAGDGHPGEFMSDDQSGGVDPEMDPEPDGETDGTDEAPAEPEEER